MSIFTRAAAPAAPGMNYQPQVGGAPDPYASSAPAAIDTTDAYNTGVVGPGTAATSPAPAGVGALAGGLGMGGILGTVGGALLGWKVLLPKIAMRVAPKVPPSMFLKFGVIGGAALAGGWLLSKLLGHNAAPQA